MQFLTSILVTLLSASQIQPPSYVSKPNASVSIDAYYKWIEMYKDILSNQIPSKPPNHLRLASYNLHYQVDRRDDSDSTRKILQTITHINPDVLVLQELSVPQEKRFRKHLDKLGYRIASICRTNEELANAVVVRKGIDTLHSTKFQTSYNRCAVSAEIRFNELIYNVIGTHLSVENEAKRIEEVQVILKGNMSGKNVILAGDMNSQEDELSIKMIKSAGLRNVFEGKNKPSMTCWAGTTIDFIMSSSGVIADGAYVFGSDASDHLPILVDLRSVTI